MSNQFISDLELEQHIKNLNDRELMEFTARQTYDITGIVHKHGKRITSLESTNKKVAGITGGIAAFIVAIIAAVINYFAGR